MEENKIQLKNKNTNAKVESNCKFIIDRIHLLINFQLSNKFTTKKIVQDLRNLERFLLQDTLMVGQATNNLSNKSEQKE